MNERRWDLDILRCIACFLVVVIHVTGYGIEIMEPTSKNWMIRNVVASMLRCAVPIFFMLSGIVFLNRDISVKQLYCKYIFHIIRVWIIWSSFYASIDYIAHLKNRTASIRYFLERFFSGHYHMWFLISLVGVYVLYPILKCLVNALDKKMVCYLGMVAFVWIILKETLQPFIVSPVWEGIWSYFGNFDGFVGAVYFILGYYLYNSTKIPRSRYCLIIYIGAVLGIAGVNMEFSLRHNNPLMITYGYLNVGVMVSSVFIFLFLVQIFQRIQLNENQKIVIKEVSGCTLGIYLIHTFFIEQVFRRLGLQQDNFPTIIAIILFSFLTFFLSFVSIWYIKRIPVLGKWVV